MDELNKEIISYIFSLFENESKSRINIFDKNNICSENIKLDTNDTVNIYGVQTSFQNKLNIKCFAVKFSDNEKFMIIDLTDQELVGLYLDKELNSYKMYKKQNHWIEQGLLFKVNILSAFLTMLQFNTFFEPLKTMNCYNDLLDLIELVGE